MSAAAASGGHFGVTGEKYLSGPGRWADGQGKRPRPGRRGRRRRRRRIVLMRLLSTKDGGSVGARREPERRGRLWPAVAVDQEEV